MSERNSLEVWRTCADLFYQNNEQDAYEALLSLLPKLNADMQKLIEILGQLPDGSGDEMQQKVVVDMQELVMAYECKDGLALADLLHYDIPQELELLEELKQGDLF